MAFRPVRHRRRVLCGALTSVALGALTLVGPAGTAAAAPGAGPRTATPATPASTCRMANGIKHVVDIQFDNVHLTRDNPNVPSDVEQMPHLYDFLKSEGVVMADTHDVLVHTATNFLANQTGLYPDRTGITQSNSFSYYDGAGATHTGVSFAYWTDPLYDPSGHPADTKYNMIYKANRLSSGAGTNQNVPAPWVPYTRAGCNVGEVGMSNEVLENIATDIPTVFGAGSPEAAEAASNPAKATADYVGLAVHCTRTSAVCAHGTADVLPDEPGGYAGYRADFGNAEIQPAVSPDAPMKALDGTPITDAHGNPGFPGFDSEVPNVSLGYAATLLEHGVDNVNVYLSDVHGDHTAAQTGDMGPGQQTYEQQLHDYDTAFEQFITRLASDGITPANTVFSLNDDEGDHFSGSAPTPAGCTGQPGNYCSYAVRSEVNVNLPGLLATERGNTTPFAIHSDPAPSVWVTGNPAPTSATARQLARDVSSLSVTNPLTGGTDRVAYQLAGPAEENILHFVSADPARTPTLTGFSGEDDYIGGGAPNCSQSCVYTTGGGYAWNHGGLWPDMQTIWSGLVGPGVSARGIDAGTFTDQVDMRPTILELAGLSDDYQVDGRVLLEELDPSVLPAYVRANESDLLALSRSYKQLLASTGEFDMATLQAETAHIGTGTTTDDHTYRSFEATLTALGRERDTTAYDIAQALLGAEFGHRTPAVALLRALTAQADRLIARAQDL